MRVGAPWQVVTVVTEHMSSYRVTRRSHWECTKSGKPDLVGKG